MCPGNADHITKLVTDKDVGFLASYCATAAYFAEFQKGPSGPFTSERLRRENKMVEGTTTYRKTVSKPALLVTT